jgi:hypothetical protein
MNAEPINDLVRVVTHPSFQALVRNAGPAAESSWVIELCFDADSEYFTFTEWMVAASSACGAIQTAERGAPAWPPHLEPAFPACLLRLIEAPGFDGLFADVGQDGETPEYAVEVAANAHQVGQNVRLADKPFLVGFPVVGPELSDVVCASAALVAAHDATQAAHLSPAERTVAA